MGLFASANAGHSPAFFSSWVQGGPVIFSEGSSEGSTLQSAGASTELSSQPQ